MSMSTYGCSHCHQGFVYEPKTWSQGGMPAKTWYFCSTDCLNAWLHGEPGKPIIAGNPTFSTVNRSERPEPDTPAEVTQEPNRALRAVFTNEVIRAIGALARQQNVCREQGGQVVFVTGMEAAREYIVEHVNLAAKDAADTRIARLREQIAGIVAEMRMMALIAGQASVEALSADQAAVDARFAEYAGKWADRLAALVGGDQP